jgi:hypothetical protein
MNKELLKLVKVAKAPKQMLKEPWFQEFCANFASVILAQAEEALQEEAEILLAQKQMKRSSIN